jgi:hypothetical protein
MDPPLHNGGAAIVRELVAMLDALDPSWWTGNAFGSRLR